MCRCASTVWLCASRSIEEAIRSSEISILARLASITLAAAISCDPRLYKSDTSSSRSSPPKRKDMQACTGVFRRNIGKVCFYLPWREHRFEALERVSNGLGAVSVNRRSGIFKIFECFSISIEPIPKYQFTNLFFLFFFGNLFQIFRRLKTSSLNSSS